VWQYGQHGISCGAQNPYSLEEEKEPDEIMFYCRGFIPTDTTRPVFQYARPVGRISLLDLATTADYYS
jgi:hypothetical protein